MTKEEAEKRIQELLAEAAALADEHKVEFKFLGCSMRYYVDGEPAPYGLMISDDEWQSSNCYGPRDRWYHEAWLVAERKGRQ